jgi:pimeloyl-ACP methyl ester carboxylesterase
MSIRYRVGGSGDCLVWLEDSDGFAGKKIHDILSNDYLVIILEIPQSAGSFQGSAGEWQDALIRSVYSIVRSHHLERFSVIAGSHAFELAFRMAAYNPKMVEDLVLFAPSAADLENLPEGQGFRRWPVKNEQDNQIEAASKTLVLFGADDQRFSSQSIGACRKKLPNCHAVMVYGAGAEVESDRPEAVAAFVSDFLKRKENFLVQMRSSVIYR